MAILSVLIAPDPRLKLKAKPVAAVDAAVRRLMDDMLETMYVAPGIGLAAPQVGRAMRHGAGTDARKREHLRREHALLRPVVVQQLAITVDVARDEEEKQPLRMANPEILWRSDELATYNEGCLSLPEHYADVTRPAEIRVRYLDHENEIREMAAQGLLATVIQHEMDHLQGVLFVDHISPLKRNIILRKLAKSKRLAEPEPA